MDLNTILSKLGASVADAVYLSVTPGIGLEIIKLDKKTRSIKSYAHRPLKYNTLLREIEDFVEFKETVIKLFEDIGISEKCNVAITLPTVFFGVKEVPAMLTEEAIQEVLTSEVEQAFVFRNQEPAIRSAETPLSSAVDMRKILFSAVQKQQLENIERVIKEIGAKLVKIELSLFSVIRALAFGELAVDQMRKDTEWNMMLINDNGYSIYSMSDQHIVDYHEEFLAINSLEEVELYDLIGSSVQMILGSLSQRYLYIISETDLVSATVLADRIAFPGKIEFIENNLKRKEEVIPLNFETLSDKSSLITLEAVGIGATDFISLPMRFNFQNFGKEDLNEPVPIRIFGYLIELSPLVATKLAAILLVFMMLILLFPALYFPLSSKGAKDKLAELEAKAEKLGQEYNVLNMSNSSTGAFNADKEIEKVLSNNRTKLMSYSSLGGSIPKNVWLTYYVAKDDGKVDIKGQATDIEDIYTFFKNLKDSLLNTQLKLYKLETVSDLDEVVMSAPNLPAIYNFEITNMSDAELAPPVEEGAEGTPLDPTAVKKPAKGGASAPGETAPADGGAAPGGKKPNALEPIEP